MGQYVFLGFFLFLGLWGNHFVASKAVDKGYKYWCWFFQSWLGIVLLAFAPTANDPKLSDQQRTKRQSTWNTVGLVGEIIALLITTLATLANL
jgi:hypothetical protein